MLKVAVIDVGVTEVIKAGEIVVSGVSALVSKTVAPGWKYVPGIVTATVVPGAPVGGVNGAVIVGGLLMTVKPFGSVPYCKSGFVTTTFHDPAVAASRSNVQVICVEDKVTMVPVISGESVRVSFTVAPSWNPVPTRSVMETGQPRLPESGVMLVTEGVLLRTPVIVIDAVVLAAAAETNKRTAQNNTTQRIQNLFCFVLPPILHRLQVN